ncbi:DUF4345 domain-containing protein [Streptosporangium amethystogenes subsp. fukuiense]|uniref:DUF4345 domain-containing protein n=1 Tax=Streptosporangium amethystogenes subsp. fukuiense TaxID=698418 RepID=A0ABW2T0T9_9ACTN
MRLILLVSGVVAVGIGAATLFAPAAFHGANGIELGSDAGLLSETRAAGGALLAAGALILLGAFVARLAFTATVVGAATYLAYGLSRLLSIALDGIPASGLVLAAALELIIGLACAFALVRDRRQGGRETPA